MKTNCPVCDGVINIDIKTEISEIISCHECKSRLEVTDKNDNLVTLLEAPKVEEDWGE